MPLARGLDHYRGLLREKLSTIAFGAYSDLREEVGATTKALLMALEQKRYIPLPFDHHCHCYRRHLDFRMKSRNLQWALPAGVENHFARLRCYFVVAEPIQRPEKWQGSAREHIHIPTLSIMLVFVTRFSHLRLSTVARLGLP